MERLFINGKQCNLTAGDSGFAKTLQCNDLANIASRQTNRTMSIKLPFTPINDEIFGNLSFMGSQSQFPYQKNTCDLFYANDKIIHNGWANINQTSKAYEIHVYDGTVDLWKAIENKTLGDLYIGEITHTKSLTAVTNTWSNDLDYSYILADYGGKTIVSGDSINIDYLVPSVKVKYLWDRIFDTFGYTYTGSVFETIDFNNLWMTYPKGVNPEANDNIIPIKSFQMFTTVYGRGDSARYILDSTAYTDSYITIIQTPNSNANGYGNTDEHIKLLSDGGKYNIKINGKINTVKVGNQSESAPVDIWFVTNSEDDRAPAALVSPIRFREKLAEGITFNHTLDIDYNFQLGMNETFSLVAATPAAYQATFIAGTDFTVDLGIYDDPLYDFQNELKDFSITDFFKEIIWHYGLTFYKDEFSNNYEFRTLNEVMNGDVVNWSSKFQNVTNEKYTYNSYGQSNAFKYKYNEENANHNDGYLFVNNLNLDEKKDVINSKIYSPESETTSLTELNDVHIYKMWNKEVKDDGEVKYKGLNKKYYFLRGVDYEFASSQTIVSESTSGSTIVNSAKVETYQGIGWNDVINDYYLPLFNILNNTRIINAVFWLTPNDIANFDFRKLYYIEQLGGSFLINKITNYKVNKPVTVELIKVNK
ncbi:hypothetical protein ABGT15_04495 [Flavobacterium enshiense]|uniref:hypothetical protein n=1 Tax=Flavobacterium enshiense TaxID=1341165 RepID=UPI00345CA2BC